MAMVLKYRKGGLWRRLEPEPDPYRETWEAVWPQVHFQQEFTSLRIECVLTVWPQWNLWTAVGLGDLRIRRTAPLRSQFQDSNRTLPERDPQSPRFMAYRLPWLDLTVLPETPSAVSCPEPSQSVEAQGSWARPLAVAPKDRSTVGGAG